MQSSHSSMGIISHPLCISSLILTEWFKACHPVTGVWQWMPMLMKKPQSLLWAIKVFVHESCNALLTRSFAFINGRCSGFDILLSAPELTVIWCQTVTVCRSCTNSTNDSFETLLGRLMVNQFSTCGKEEEVEESLTIVDNATLGLSPRELLWRGSQLKCNFIKHF